MQSIFILSTVYCVHIAAVYLIAKCILCAPLESAFIKLHTIIWTSDPYASSVLHADMKAIHSTSIYKTLNSTMTAACRANYFTWTKLIWYTVRFVIKNVNIRKNVFLWKGQVTFLQILPVLPFITKGDQTKRAGFGQWYKTSTGMCDKQWNWG